MYDKQQPQQSTLSVRIPQSLRNYLERLRTALGNGRGERFSLSDAAKVLLEEAQHAPLDERLRVSSLLLDPTGTLLAIRSKWERQAVLSPAEWVVLARYVEVACEGTPDDAALPKRESFLELLKAFRALLKLRIAQPSRLDPYYLSKLPPAGFERDGDDARATTVGALVDNLIAHLSEPSSQALPVYVGRTLHVALRDEDYPSALALHHALLPFLPTMFRLAARGHWLEQHRPVRPPNAPLGSIRDPHTHPHFPPVIVHSGEFQLTTLVTDDGDLEMALNMKSRDALFALGPYPQIREFVSLLERLPETDHWRGVAFIGYTDGCNRGANVTRFYFRHCGAAFGFSPEEWDALKEAFRQVFRLPEMAAILTELQMQYGDV